MKNNGFLKFLISCLSVVCISLTSCKSNHEHTYSSSYEYDDTYHWHPSTCGHDVRSGEEKHIFTISITYPTYEQGGYTTYTCTTCGYSYVDNETDKLEHNYSSSWSYDEDSHWHACTDKGYEHLKKDESSHNFTSIVTDPTYEQGGYTTYTCSTCGYSYTDNETDKLEHNYSSSWSYDEDSHWHACTDKGYEYLKKDESSHNFTSVVTDPTYEQGGYTTYTCSTCGYSYVDNETDKLFITVTWKNYDGTILEVDNDVSYGTTPTYDGATPVRESDDRYNYTFAGWTPEVGPVIKDTTYTAVFSNEEITYTVTWKNYDGTILEVDDDVSYGTTPTYDGATPVKESDDRYNYEFNGWTPEIGPVIKDTTYTATFSNEEITYTIDFDLNGGTSSSYKGSIEVTTFSKDIFFFDCVKEDWQFRGWEYNGEKIFDEKGNQLKNVTLVDNMVFRAIYSQTVKLTITTNMPEAGTITGEGEYPYNTYVDVSVTPNQGYKFVGWYYQNTLLSNEENYKYMMWDKDITLEARFERDDFNLRIYTNNEDYGLVLWKFNPVVNEYLPEYTGLEEYGSEVTIAAYSKSDVRFLGWYDENNELVTTNAVYTFVMPNYDYTLEAKWNYFTINYNLNGGTNNKNNVDHFDLEDNTIYLFAPTKEGYSFEGWKYNGEFVEKIDTSIANNITLEAVWSSYKYEIREDDNGKYAVIIDYQDSITDVVIPEYIEVNGEQIVVKVIKDNTFYDNGKITSITIPDSVTTIGYSAFSGCSNLTTITISENSQLTTIGEYAFSGCSSLTSIYIPDSLTSIGDYVFYYCTSLTTVTISENSQLTTIGESAFDGCSSLTSIYIPDSVTSIGDYAFRYCSNLKTVTIGENSQLTTIGERAFSDCSSLTSIYIPDSVSTIGAYTFYKCTNLTTVTISENSQLTTIGDCAFQYCSSLTSIYIPDSVTSIGDYAFRHCYNLKTVTIGENSQLTTIGDFAFYGCSSLTSIYIPSSVTTIGYAFGNCSNLIIYCEASSRPSGWDSIWNDSDRPVVWSCSYDEYLEAIS